MTIEQKVIKNKVGLLNLAQSLGNVSCMLRTIVNAKSGRSAGFSVHDRRNLHLGASVRS